MRYTERQRKQPPLALAITTNNVSRVIFVPYAFIAERTQKNKNIENVGDRASNENNSSKSLP